MKAAGVGRKGYSCFPIYVTAQAPFAHAYAGLVTHRCVVRAQDTMIVP